VTRGDDRTGGGRQHAPAVSGFRQAVRRALLAAGVARGDAVVIACSHGPDSLALADAVLALRRALGLGEVTLVYVDHGLRAAAAEEGRRVRALAAQAGAHAVVRRVSLDRRRGGGSEEAARAARYGALEAVADERGARWILVGHTASDQAETVLQRLLRGAGPVGLAGIPARRGRVLRPLLALPREAVSAYLTARKLEPSHDESNAEPVYLRNRVRHALLPALRAENPSIDAGLRRTAEAMRELAEALDWAAERAEATLDVVREADGVSVSAAALVALPPGLAKRCLQRLAAGLGGSPEAVHLDAIFTLCHAKDRRVQRIEAPGVILVRSGSRLSLTRVASSGTTERTAGKGKARETVP
jgi:tRNA(Ile)-lysidine synthase